MKIVSIASARPNFVKLAAVHHALAEHAPEIEHIILHTGQHYDPLLSDIFFEQLEIPQPKFNLGVHAAVREDVIAETEHVAYPILKELEPDIVVVYGDVNGAVGGARAAKSLGIKLAHVEAGLRSYDLSMPEEHNRIEVDGLADILLCSEQSGIDHLQEEEIKGDVHLVGNTMIDTLIRMQQHIAHTELPPGLPEEFAVVTLHRPSNVDEKEALHKNLAFLGEVSQSMHLILPAHHRLLASIDRFDLRSLMLPTISLLPPFGYLPFLRLVEQSAFILTDSGGIQEEAAFLQKKCFTLRMNTERPSTLESGSNTLIDLEKKSDREMVLAFAKHPGKTNVTVPSLWDGKAGERIVTIFAAA